MVCENVIANFLYKYNVMEMISFLFSKNAFNVLLYYVTPYKIK